MNDNKEFNAKDATIDALEENIEYRKAQFKSLEDYLMEKISALRAENERLLAMISGDCRSCPYLKEIVEAREYLAKRNEDED